MSAFQVSDRHIDAMVYARTVVGLTNVAPDLTDSQLGRKFLRENMLSLAARYRDPIDDAAIEAYHYTRPVKALSVVQLIKAIRCFEYQACEHRDWEESDACAYCAQIVELLIQHLPGYAEAAWGLE